jgi:hypothetical protein
MKPKRQVWRGIGHHPMSYSDYTIGELQERGKGGESTEIEKREPASKVRRLLALLALVWLAWLLWDRLVG